MLNCLLLYLMGLHVTAYVGAPWAVANRRGPSLTVGVEMHELVGRVPFLPHCAGPQLGFV